MLESGVLLGARWASLFQLAWGSGILIIQLSIYPTYQISVRVACIINALVFTALGMFGSMMFIDFLRQPSSSMRTRDLVIWGVYQNIWIIYPTLLRTLCSEITASGRLTHRLALRRLWMVFRFQALIMGVSNILAASMNAFWIGPDCEDELRSLHVENVSSTTFQTPCADDLATQLPVVALSVCAMWWLFMALWMSPYNRGRVVYLLGRILLGDAAEGAQSAAILAPMLPHGRAASLTIKAALSKLRALPFDKLTVDDLTSSTDSNLYPKTSPAELGSITAFVSHSWSDAAIPKFAMLSQWAHGHHEPNLWLDKACVDQNNITEDLLNLPIFLASCKELLVLAGPSYCGRLWCVLEFYTFVMVRPKLGGLVIETFEDAASPTDVRNQRAGVRRRFGSFDAAKASCYLEEDRHNLLAVIEAGYGSIPAFNQKMLRIIASLPDEAEPLRRSFQGKAAAPRRQGQTSVHMATRNTI